MFSGQERKPTDLTLGVYAPHISCLCDSLLYIYIYVYQYDVPGHADALVRAMMQLLSGDYWILQLQSMGVVCWNCQCNSNWKVFKCCVSHCEACQLGSKLQTQRRENDVQSFDKLRQVTL
jgi:hypothetical protein